MKRTTCGSTRAPWGWWCSRDLDHAGPCAARRIPTPWGLAWEWVARRLPDRKRLVDAVNQLQEARRRRQEDLVEIYRQKSERAEDQATIVRLTQHLEAAQARIADLEARPSPADAFKEGWHAAKRDSTAGDTEDVADAPDVAFQEHLRRRGA